ncbi:MAG: hypothetical protein Q9197_003340, partial [Variospora fuerteventurae]
MPGGCAMLILKNEQTRLPTPRPPAQLLILQPSLELVVCLCALLVPVDPITCWLDPLTLGFEVDGVGFLPSAVFSFEEPRMLKEDDLDSDVEAM